MNISRLLLDLQDQEAIKVYARDCRRRNDDGSLRALGLQLIDSGASVKLSPGDPVEWLERGQSHSLMVGGIGIPFLWGKRRAVSLACDVAELVLPVFEAEHPEDDRPRVAIKTARAWLRSEANTDDCYCAADAAWSSAVIVADTAYADAAYAYAAYTASDAAYVAARDAARVVASAAARAAARAADSSSENPEDWLRENVVPLIVKYALAEEV